MAERGVGEKAELRRRLREEDRQKPPTLRSPDPLQGTADTAARYEPLGLHRYSTLFTFLSLPGEPDTSALNRLALEQGLTLAAPRVEGENLGFYRLYSADGPFEKGPYGIREPLPSAPVLWKAAMAGPGENEDPARKLDFPLLIAVPGLAFTPDGRRLGRGKGYYDRFLASFLEACIARRREITLLGLCPPGRLLQELPTESHDIRVDCLIAEKEYIISSDIG